MACKKCNKDKRIVNKHFGLCLECNNMRLHGSPYGKSYNPIKRSSKLRKTSKNKKKSSNIEITLDEIFYKTCFESSDHRCEECGKQLPEIFRDDNGRIVARWRYSHIIPKSIAPKLRREVLNINHLCLEHHQQWDHGDKKSMSIYESNERNRIPILRKIEKES